MKLAALAGLLALTLGTRASSADSAPPAFGHATLAHAFGDGAAKPDAAPDVEATLEQRPGQVRKGGAAGKELLDMADYSRVAKLVLTRELLLGPSDPPVLLDAGEYACDLAQGGTGMIQLTLHGPGGMRLSLSLAELPAEPDAPTTHVSRASMRAFEQPGDSWVLAFELPTAAGALILTPPSETGAARTRSEAVRRVLRDRLVHGSSPVRRVPR